MKAFCLWQINALLVEWASSCESSSYKKSKTGPWICQHVTALSFSHASEMMWAPHCSRRWNRNSHLPVDFWSLSLWANRTIFFTKYLASCALLSNEPTHAFLCSLQHFYCSPTCRSSGCVKSLIVLFEKNMQWLSFHSSRGKLLERKRWSWWPGSKHPFWEAPTSFSLAQVPLCHNSCSFSIRSPVPMARISSL